MLSRRFILIFKAIAASLAHSSILNENRLNSKILRAAAVGGLGAMAYLFVLKHFSALSKVLADRSVYSVPYT